MKNLLSDISILIVTWKGDELLRNCLDSLAATCGRIPEIVVVDNAVLSSTRNIAASYPNVKYVESPENPGFAGGNNAGIKFCTRKYVLLLNNDTVIHTAESILALAKYLETHETVGAVQGTMRLSRQGDILDECGSYINGFGGLFARWVQCPLNSKVSEGAVFYAKGAFLMFKREILKDLEDELFDGSFWSYFEDADFCLRIWITGREVHYVDTEPIDHLCGVTAAKFGVENVNTRCVRNQLYSYLTMLEGRSRWAILPSFFFHFNLIVIRRLLALDTGMLKALCHIVADLWRNRRNIETRRKYQHKIRKIKDKAFWGKVKAEIPLGYYWHELKGMSQKELWDLFGRA